MTGVWFCIRPGLVGDIIRSCRFQRAVGAVDAALRCIAEMAAMPALQVTPMLASTMASYHQFTLNYHCPAN